MLYTGSVTDGNALQSGTRTSVIFEFNRYVHVQPCQSSSYQISSGIDSESRLFESNMLVCSQDFLRSADPECSAFKLSISRHPSQSFPSGKGGLGHERLNPEEYPRHPWIKKCGLYMGSYEI